MRISRRTLLPLLITAGSEGMTTTEMALHPQFADSTSYHNRSNRVSAVLRELALRGVAEHTGYSPSPLYLHQPVNRWRDSITAPGHPLGQGSARGSAPWPCARCGHSSAYHDALGLTYVRCDRCPSGWCSPSALLPPTGLTRFGKPTGITAGQPLTDFGNPVLTGAGKVSAGQPGGFPSCFLLLPFSSPCEAGNCQPHRFDDAPSSPPRIPTSAPRNGSRDANAQKQHGFSAPRVSSIARNWQPQRTGSTTGTRARASAPGYAANCASRG